MVQKNSLGSSLWIWRSCGYKIEEEACMERNFSVYLAWPSPSPKFTLQYVIGTDRGPTYAYRHQTA
jgi:hypothetical protein